MLICFDYDGVIADTFDKLLNICKESQRALGSGRPPVEDDFRHTENLTFSHLAKQLGIPRHAVSRFAGEVFSRLGTDPDEVFASMPSVLSALSRNHTLCVVTANTVEKVGATLKHHGILDCFSALYGGESGFSKSEQITRTCDQFGFSKEDCLMVGDTLGDIRQAQVANVRSIAVTWGYQKREFLDTASPDFYADLPGQLSTIATTQSNKGRSND